MNRMWMILFTGLLLFGCRANEDSISQFVEQARNGASAQVEPLLPEYEFIADKFVMT